MLGGGVRGAEIRVGPFVDDVVRPGRHVTAGEELHGELIDSHIYHLPHSKISFPLNEIVSPVTHGVNSLLKFLVGPRAVR